MNPLTAEFLRASAALAAFAQARPTDAAGLRLRREARNRAEAAWAQAGAPDAPANAPTPTCAPDFTARPPREMVNEDGKDWTRVEVLVEVRAMTDAAVLLRDSEGRGYWCPRAVALVKDQQDALDIGDVCEMTVPAWVIESGRVGPVDSGVTSRRGT